MRKRQNNNPYDICIFRPESECQECPLRTQLDCHFSLKKLLRFMFSFLFIVILGSMALIVNGFLKEFYGFLVALVLFGFIFFEFWEIRILCRHCPFYAENRKTIHCYANYGSLKVWKFHPEPMSMSEKIQLIIAFSILTGILLFPSVFLTTREFYLWAVPPFVGLLIFGYILKKYHCPNCLNFSCPFNAVPQVVADEFLQRNPAMSGKTGRSSSLT